MATCWIHVPTSDTDWPPRKRRTFRDRRLPKARARGGFIGGRRRVTGRPPAVGSRALQLVAIDRQGADTPARRRVDRVAHRGRDGGHARLPEASRRLAGVEDVDLDDRHLVDAKHRVIAEVRSLTPTA